MRIYHSQAEVEKDIKNGILKIEDDVKFECSISLKASINAWGDINAKDIIAANINAWDINAKDIIAANINAWNIDAQDILIVGDIIAANINAWDIDAGNISYYAFCCSYNSIKCHSIVARRKKHADPICLNGKLELIS